MRSRKKNPSVVESLEGLVLVAKTVSDPEQRMTLANGLEALVTALTLTPEDPALATLARLVHDESTRVNKQYPGADAKRRALLQLDEASRMIEALKVNRVTIEDPEFNQPTLFTED